VTHNTVELFVGEPVGVFRGERDPAVSANVPHICTVTSFGVDWTRSRVCLLRNHRGIAPYREGERLERGRTSTSGSSSTTRMSRFTRVLLT
jgi:hypothetical protein